MKNSHLTDLQNSQKKIINNCIHSEKSVLNSDIIDKLRLVWAEYACEDTLHQTNNCKHFRLETGDEAAQHIIVITKAGYLINSLFQHIFTVITIHWHGVWNLDIYTDYSCK